jgi:transposase-like protein
MATFDAKIACQRCGEPMTLIDPGPDGPWRPDQFWVCPKCGRHFWTSYPAPAAPPVKPAPATGGQAPS